MQRSEQFKTDAEGRFVSTGLIVDGNPPDSFYDAAKDAYGASTITAYDVAEADTGRWRRVWCAAQPTEQREEYRPLPEGIEGWADASTR